MKYGFFGGSFNPPTLAHLAIASESIKVLNLDKVFFVPMSDMYNKPDLINQTYRYDMLQLLCENNEKLATENIELNLNKNLSAIEAFKLIENKYNNSDNYYIMGADNFIKMPNWDNASELIKNYKYIVFTRNNIDIIGQIQNKKLLQENKKNIHILQLTENIECSSGIIRKAIKESNEQTAKRLLSTKVFEYIKKNKLYDIK